MTIIRSSSGRLLVSVVLAVALAGLFGCSMSEPKKEADFSGVDAVCELATLECYYHNVAKADIPKENGFMGDLFNKGYKRLWVEYDGTVKVGIDVSEVVIDPADENGVVKVHVPEAKVLSVNFDKKSLTEPISETGLFTDITADEKTIALKVAQTGMKDKASSNKAIVVQAKSRAKVLLEQYVKNVGAVVGENYTVEWV